MAKTGSLRIALFLLRELAKRDFQGCYAGCMLGLLLSSICVTGCDGFLDIHGVVRDASGKPLPDARVVLEYKGGRRFEESTDSAGCFSVGSTVAPGMYRYHLRVEKALYEPAAADVPLATPSTVAIVLVSKGSGDRSRVLSVKTVPCP